MLGLTLEQPWSFRDVLALMAKSAGVVADPGHRWGQDTIDPDRTIDALDAMGDRIAAVLSRGAAQAAVRHRAPHRPAGRPPAARQVRRRARGDAADARRGLDLLGVGLRPPAQDPLPRRRRDARRQGRVRAHPRLGPDGADARPSSATASPDLVIADHGWAGAAGEAGVPTVASPTATTPGSSWARRRARSTWSCPLDDNVLPRYYAPLTDHSGHTSLTRPYESNSVLPIRSFRACIPRGSPSLCQLLMQPGRLLCVTSWTVPTSRRGARASCWPAIFAGSADRRLRRLRK